MSTVASRIRKLARDNKISAEPDRMGLMAMTITSLAGDSVKLDGVERLLVSLKKSGVLSTSEILRLQSSYLVEKAKAKAKSNAKHANSSRSGRSATA
ncbi:hypothetical protein ACFW0H_25940 [Pseudomonas sp. CR3202]|uniref:hypothetical protein n=1 Tax=Pseudomonas sp. CR3202 TaxID=3351532 RepID=UPI003BF0F4CC